MRVIPGGEYLDFWIDRMACYEQGAKRLHGARFLSVQPLCYLRIKVIPVPKDPWWLIIYSQETKSIVR